MNDSTYSVDSVDRDADLFEATELYFSKWGCLPDLMIVSAGDSFFAGLKTYFVNGKSLEVWVDMFLKPGNYILMKHPEIANVSLSESEGE